MPGPGGGGARPGVLVEDLRRALTGGLGQPPRLVVEGADRARREVQHPAGVLLLGALDEGQVHLPGVAPLARGVPGQAGGLDAAGGQAVDDELAQHRGVLLPADAAGLGLLHRPAALGQDGALEAPDVVDVHARGLGDLLGAGPGAHERLQGPGPQIAVGGGDVGRGGEGGGPGPAHRGAQGVVDDDAVPLAVLVRHDDAVAVAPQQFELDHGVGPPSIPASGFSVPPAAPQSREVSRCARESGPGIYSRSALVVLLCACPARRDDPAAPVSRAAPGGRPAA